MYHEHHFFCAECGDPFVEAKMKNRKRKFLNLFAAHTMTDAAHYRRR